MRLFSLPREFPACGQGSSASTTEVVAGWPASSLQAVTTAGLCPSVELQRRPPFNPSSELPFQPGELSVISVAISHEVFSSLSPDYGL